MRPLATILSALFHPLLMPTYGIAIALYTSYMRFLGGTTLSIALAGVALTTCILPTLGILILYKMKVISDFRLYNRTERTIPYIFSFICYALGYLFLYQLGAPRWILSFMACAIISLIIVLFINRYWKISAHMTAAGALVALVLLMCFSRLMLTPFILPLQISTILLAGAMGSARILLGRHTLGQVAAGFALGATGCITLFLIFT